MKALVLAAGLGTRLRPHSERLPKPLFPVGGRPMLLRLLAQLEAAGCEAAAVNTHHLAELVERCVAGYSGRMPVLVRRESLILGTGGAIRNLADFWDRRPFMVINADIVCRIDLAAVYRFHTSHPHPATLVVTDFPAINSVTLDGAGAVVSLRSPPCPSPDPPPLRHRTFTGIQTLDPLVLDFLPPGGFADSIAAFEALQAAGYRLQALEIDAGDWIDAGTPERYRRAAAEALMPEAFQQAYGRHVAPRRVQWEALAGDGSDRRWFRLKSEAGALILADHGLPAGPEPTEAQAFVAIGRHLHRRGVPVPAIRAAEPFAGQVLLDDLGDLHLQTAVRQQPDAAARRALYARVIAVLVHMARAGAEGFDPAWCHQAPRYDRRTIVEAEGGYFLEAYVRGVAGIAVASQKFRPAFDHLARCIGRLEAGFMHRDFQSRNLMMVQGRIGVIDFQGGRLGPMAYDLASLLIDPYVDLPRELQDVLVAEAVRQLSLTGAAAEDFRAGFAYCALARHLQMLGAFGHLSRVKGKTGFATYIPAALQGLRRRLEETPDPPLAPLRELVRRL